MMQNLDINDLISLGYVNFNYFKFYMNLTYFPFIVT